MTFLPLGLQRLIDRAYRADPEATECDLLQLAQDETESCRERYAEQLRDALRRLKIESETQCPVYRAK